jgi:hypothetical protein
LIVIWETLVKRLTKDTQRRHLAIRHVITVEKTTLSPGNPLQVSFGVLPCPWSFGRPTRPRPFVLGPNLGEPTSHPCYGGIIRRESNSRPGKARRDLRKQGSQYLISSRPNMPGKGLTLLVDAAIPFDVCLTGRHLRITAIDDPTRGVGAC